jgi:hypothetical protein
VGVGVGVGSGCGSGTVAVNRWLARIAPSTTTCSSQL